ncbi:MAG TPA: glycosyltransferase, partial [Candidatus Obscuribacterales bacterium]
TAGLDHAEGHAAVNLDSDLQDPPELIPQMVKLWKDGYDVVYVQRSTRRDRFAKRFSAHLFYRFLGSISTVQIPEDTGDFRLLDRRVITALQSLPEKTRFLRGMIPWLGFKQKGIAIDRGARERGESTYTLRKLFTLAIDGILSFSFAPLYMLAPAGALMAAAGVALFIAGLFAPSGAPQLIMLIAALLAIFAGIQLACMGVVGVYLAKTLDESRSRPTYIVSRLLGAPFASSGADVGSSIQQAPGQRQDVSGAGPFTLSRSYTGSDPARTFLQSSRIPPRS